MLICKLLDGFYYGGVLFLYCNQLCTQDQEQFLSLLFIISLSLFFRCVPQVRPAERGIDLRDLVQAGERVRAPQVAGLERRCCGLAAAERRRRPRRRRRGPSGGAAVKKGNPNVKKKKRGILNEYGDSYRRGGLLFVCHTTSVFSPRSLNVLRPPALKNLFSLPHTTVPLLLLRRINTYSCSLAAITHHHHTILHVRPWNPPPSLAVGGG